MKYLTTCCIKAWRSVVMACFMACCISGMSGWEGIASIHIVHAAGIPLPHNPMRAPTIASSRQGAAGVQAHVPSFGEALRTGAQDAAGWGMLGLLAGYRNHISIFNGRQSDLAPAHSLYAHQAMAHYGTWKGVMLTTARLLHESDEWALLSPITDSSLNQLPRQLGYDPLWANTWWWDEQAYSKLAYNRLTYSK